MTEKKAHFAKTETSDETFQVFFNQELILESNQAIKLSEHYDGKDFPAVIYFPRSAVTALETSKTDHTTYCPIKGEASYLNYREAANSIWCYETPYQQVSQIQGHFGFDQTKGFRVSVAS